MELLALLLLLPMTWTTHDLGPNKLAVMASAPQIESNEGRLTISPPKDSNLTMVVLEHRPEAARSIASTDESSRVESSRIIEVIVTAP